MKQPLIKYSVTFCLLGLLITSLASCSKPTDKVRTTPKVLKVKSGASIQKVVDIAVPGDVILVDSGTYSGDIVVTTEDITIRGVDRNTVILDGKFKQDNGILFAANGVRVENLTVQAFRTNGILIQGGYDSGDTDKISTVDIVERYSVQYVNALNNGLYGIYAFATSDGIIQNTYTKANADAGIYLGQCKPCNAIVVNNKAEMNGLGFQGANASKNVYIFSNEFSNNRTGIHLVSEIKEKMSPQTEVIVNSNNASNNNQENAPTATPDLFGFGIVVAGGTSNTIENNTTDGNAQVGLALVENNDFLPTGNTFKNNMSRNNGSPFGFDIAYLISGRPDVMSLSNCFENNSYSSSSIDRIQEVLPCENAAPGPFHSQPLRTFKIPAAPDYSSIAIETQDQTNQPGSANKIPGKLRKIKKSDIEKLYKDYEN